MGGRLIKNRLIEIKSYHTPHAKAFMHWKGKAWCWNMW